MQILSLRRWRALWSVVLSLTFAAAAAAQTPEQLEIFRNLTPEQQQAVLQQTGQQGDTESTASSSGNIRRGEAAADDQRRVPPQLPPPDTTLQPGSSVLVEVGRESSDLAAADRARIQRLTELIRLGNPYELDDEARLNLPGFLPVPLGGLTEQQAVRLLNAEPALLGLDVKLMRLPLRATGVKGLKRYGYDLFDNALSRFSPVAGGAVPADYVVRPGDEFNIQLFGNQQNRSLRLPVNREGAVNFPELGPIVVGGMTFGAARRAIESRVEQQMIGMRASVAMGEIRDIQVLVVGEAKVPGSYTVNGFGTMMDALYASGGVKPIGSLRDIQLKRQDKIISHLDLYDLQISGNRNDDARLQHGDVIFIPTVGATISVDGEVKRPAIYELKGEASIAAVVSMAGGFTPEADMARISLVRIDAGSRRVLDINLSQPAGGSLMARNGDELRVARLRPQLDSGVTLEGFVHRPGVFAWREGLRLTDVIGSVDELRPGADQHFILVRRESGADRRISVVLPDLGAALAAPTSTANILLSPRDRITVFDLAPGRDRIIAPLLQELRLQSDLASPTLVVGVGGRVKVPGDYPLEPGMRIADLLRAGGGLDPAAYGGNAELTRYSIDQSGARQTELIQVDLAALRRGDAGANVLLQSSDYLVVKETPNWAEQESVTLRGEVSFPGTYPIRRGETLRQVLERAGGLTALAFPEGSILTRASLREQEQQQLDRLSDSMRTELTSLALQAANSGNANAAEALQAGQALLAQLQSTKATGRFIIDLPQLLAGAAGKDIVLRDGDELIIPKQRQEVTVIGEVQNAASHQFLSGLGRADYIAMSGGVTRKADRGRIYVVRADGRTATRSSSWLARNYDEAIKPGDTIVVPLDTQRMPRLQLWQAVTQILYNVAVSVAAVNSF